MNYLANTYISVDDFDAAALSVKFYGFEGSDQLATMTEKEKRKLIRNLHTLQRASKEVAKQLKQAEIDGQDWDKIIREARKRFNYVDIAILQTLEDGEYYLNYDGIKERIDDFLPRGTKSTSQVHNSIRLRTRRLMRMGLVHMSKGLFTEDGEVAGSGFALGKHADKARRIVAVYYPPENERLDV